MIEGRWTIWIEGDGAYIEPDSVYEKSNGDHRVPVVPCDDAAVERAVDALRGCAFLRGDERVIRHFVRKVLRAAGELPDA